MRKKIILLLVIQIFLGCNSNKTIHIKDKKITIKFDVNKFDKNKKYFITIDSIKFYHTFYLDSIIKFNNFLPRETIIVKKYDKEFYQKRNNIFLAINMAKKLEKTGLYTIEKYKSLLINGTLVFKRKDSSDININIIKPYPAKINQYSCY